MIADRAAASSASRCTGVAAPPLLAAVAAVSLAASVFYNWFWRLVVFLACWFGGAVGLLSPDTPLPATYLAAFAFWAMVHTSPVLALPFLGFRKPMPIAGTVFVTGCDSGMGFWTAALLADLAGLHLRMTQMIPWDARETRTREAWYRVGVVGGSNSSVGII